MNTTDNQARDLLKRLATSYGRPKRYEYLNSDAFLDAQRLHGEVTNFLKATEPVHPVKVAFDRWWTTDMEAKAESEGLTYREMAELASRHFFRKGLEAAAGIVSRKDHHAQCCCSTCESVSQTHARILAAAAECPKGVRE